MVVHKQGRHGAPRRSGGFRAFVYALLLHLVAGAALFFSFRWSWDQDQAGDKVIQAKVVEAPKKAARPAPRKEAQTRKAKPGPEPKKAKQEEARRRALLKKREQERRRKAEAEKKRRLAEEKKRRARREAERRRREDEQRLKEMLQAEERQRREAERTARAMAVADEYKVLIRQKVSRNWARPAGTGTGVQCLVRVRLAAGGEVLNARVVRSCGSPLFDRSVENAVYKASPLPVPGEPELFDYFREIEFLFNPED